MDWPHLVGEGPRAALARKLTLWLASAALAGSLLAPQLAAASGSGSFAATGSLVTARDGAGAARLPDGRVLVVAGCDMNSSYLAGAEIFNPQTGSFDAAGIGPMGTVRFEPAVAPLQDYFNSSF